VAETVSALQRRIHPLQMSVFEPLNVQHYTVWSVVCVKLSNVLIVVLLEN